MRTVQLSLADPAFATALRDALARSGPWRVELVENPASAQPGVLVLDEASLKQVPLPIAHPERVVLISRQDPQLLAEAWDAGIVSVVSVADSLPTVLLAIMAASLRVAKSNETVVTSGISPNRDVVPASITSADSISRTKRCRPQ